MRCAYCGDFASSRDHVIPVSSGQSMTTRSTTRKNSVPCCSECNSYLGNRHYHTVGTRAAYLVDRIEKEYQKVLSMPPWTSDEISEMGYTLKVYIKASIVLKKATKERIEHLKHIAALAPSISDVWEMHDAEEAAYLRKCCSW